MKKAIIASAIAAAVAAPAANAGVVIYGKVHVSIDMLDYEDQMLSIPHVAHSARLADNTWAVQSRASRIGFKGTEDLGNGLKLIWKAETGYDFADGGAWNAARNAYIGLSGDWGTFLYGRHDTPYKIAYYSTGIDMMGDTIADMNAMGGFIETRASNAIAYISPNMNGLTVAAAIVPGEGDLDFGVDLHPPVSFSDSTYGNGLADMYSVAAMYSNNGLKLAIAYEDLSMDLIHGGEVKNQLLLVGGGYTMNNFTVAMAYQERDTGNPMGTTDSIAVSASYSFGNNKLIGTMASLDPAGTAADRDSWAIGLEHKFSKRTKAYAIYADSENKVSGKSVSMNADLDFAGNTLLSAGSSASPKKGFSIGMIHNF